MAKRTFVSTTATQIAQIWQGTITTTTNGHTYTLPVTDELGTVYTFTYTLANPPATSTTLAATAFIAQWNADTTPVVQRVTATQNAGTVILTADAAGTPFYIGTPGGTGTWTGTGNTTTNLGNADFAIKANWVEGIVPVAGDDVTLVSGNLSYGLQQATVLTGKLTIANTWTGAIGATAEYLVSAPTAFICSANASSSSPMYVNIGSAAIAPLINSTGSPASGYGLYLLGSAMTTVQFVSGSLGIALNAGETATATTLSNLNGTVETGTGLTLTSFSQANGTGTVNAAATNLTVSAGTLTTLGTGAYTTVTVTSTGLFIGNSSGTITTLKRLGGTSDFTQSAVARTVTSESYSGGVIKFLPTVLTISNSTPLSGIGAISNTTKAL